MPLNRRRITYGASTIFMSNAPSWEHQYDTYSLKLLKRVQSASISINDQTTKSKQIGNSDFAVDNYIQYPEVNVDISYLVTNNANENLIFNNKATGNFSVLNSLAGTGQDKNLFLLFTNDEGQDASSLTSMVGSNVLAVGNAFLASYSLKAEVGSLPMANASFSCLNATFINYAENSLNPAIVLPSGTRATGYFFLTGNNMTTSNYFTNDSTRPTALRPGDITLSTPNLDIGGIKYSGQLPLAIQSMEITLPIQRKDLVGFGSNYPFDKKLMVPTVASLTFNGIFNDQVTGEVSDLFNSVSKYDFSFSLRREDLTTGLYIQLYGAKLESHNYDASIGKNTSFQSTFSIPVNQNDGMRISGDSRIY